MSNATLCLIAIAVLWSGSTAFGQSEDLIEQLLTADAQKFPVVYSMIKKDDESVWAMLIKETDRQISPDSPDSARRDLALRQVNSAIALLKVNRAESVWKLLKQSADLRVRSGLIHRLAPSGVDVAMILGRLEVESDDAIRRALILSLGEYDDQALPQTPRHQWLPKLREMFRTDTDPGIHSAVEWLLRRWQADAATDSKTPDDPKIDADRLRQLPGPDWIHRTITAWAFDNDSQEQKLAEIQKQLSILDTADVVRAAHWYVNSQGQTMVVIPGSVTFIMGSPDTEPGRKDDERQRSVRIERSFAISSHEVTWGEILRFQNPRENLKIRRRILHPNQTVPVLKSPWYEAAAYCNWISEQEGIAEDQWCYMPNESGKYEAGMSMAPDHLLRSGYRLPTDVEWEYACRAGARTAYSFGESSDLLDKYAWFRDRSVGSRMTLHPVGLLKPNDFGLFDMHGNIWEWCEETFQETQSETKSSQFLRITDEDQRVLRGGTFFNPAVMQRCASRRQMRPSEQKINIGFRLARTICSK